VVHSGQGAAGSAGLSRRKKQVGAVVALLLIAPFSAELLLGYDDLVGQPLGILISLVFFVPLYGAPALLIREVVRRTGRGWPTILLLGLAFGLVQAGLIDHGLFDPDYRAIPYWEAMRSHTFVEPLSTSAYMFSNFVVGHMIRSTAVPIAVAEALFPARADRPWLRLRGLFVVAGVWLLAATYIAWDSIRAEDYVPEPSQLVVTALLVLILVAVAFLVPAPENRGQERSVPAPALVGVLVGVAVLVHEVVPPTWPGFVVEAVVLVGMATAIYRWSRRVGWTPVHVLAAAVGAVLAHVGVAFLVQPLGAPEPGVKFGVNTALAVLAVVVLGWAERRSAPQRLPLVTAVTGAMVVGTTVLVAFAPCSVLGHTILAHSGITSCVALGANGP